jgi:hypothetical protein
MIAITSEEAMTVQRRALVADVIKRSTILAPNDVEPFRRERYLHGYK